MADSVRPRHHLWTTAEVARAFGVGVSSVKRWTDEGDLEAAKTEGGHRRFELSSLYRFASIRNLPIISLPPVEQDDLFDPLPPPANRTLLDALICGDEQAVRDLVVPHVRSVIQRATFLDRVVGDALQTIGERWARGELGVDEEHRATQMIAEAVDRLRPPIRDRSGRLAILGCPPGEAHELPLRFVRLILEWRGWRTQLAGAHLPWEAAHRAVARERPRLVALSARSRAPFQTSEFEELVATCHEANVTVVAGGSWARRTDGSQPRFRTLRAFEKWLRGFDAARD